MWIDFCRWVSESTTDKSLHTNYDLDSHINGRYRSVFGIPQPKKLEVSALPFQNTQSDIQYFFFCKISPSALLGRRILFYPPSLEKEGIPKSSLIWLSSNMQNINDDIGIPSNIQTKFPQTTLIVIKGFRGGNFQVSGETRPISYVGNCHILPVYMTYIVLILIFNTCRRSQSCELCIRIVLSSYSLRV